MAQFTKKAILNSFVRLLEKNAFDKITVKKIVDDCGINRNTFYYYFNDIYDLLDEFLITETQAALAAENGDEVSWQTWFVRSVKTAADNKRVLYNLYNSETRDRLERYLEQVIGNEMKQYVIQKAEGLHIADERIQLIADFNKNALVGFILEQIRGGINDSFDSRFKEFEKMVDLTIESALKQ